MLRWPELGGPSPAYTAVDGVLEMKRSYHGGLSIDYPFKGDNILLMSRVSQQGPTFQTQKDSNSPQFTLMDLDGPSEDLGELPFHVRLTQHSCHLTVH